MSHIGFTQAGNDVETSADYVVVGSGAGGAAAAVTLARGGASVCIVEAGPFRMPADYPESVYGAMRDMMDNWGTLLARGRAFWPIVQARLVGGTTVINSAIVVRTPGDIFPLWKEEAGIDDPGLADAVWQEQDDIEVELDVSPTPDVAAGRSNILARQAAEKVGFEGHIINRNVKDCEGSGQCLQGCKGGHKRSTNITYVPETLQKKGQLLSCAPVQKVRFEGNRAIGVEGQFVHPGTKQKGARFFVRANKAVIMAASVTWSPVILQKSGVKLKGLGEGFRAHPGCGVFGVYDEQVNMNAGATQGWASVHYRDKPGFKLETLSIPLELVASRLSGGGHELMQRLLEYPHLAMWVLACRAEAVGTVKAGLFGQPNVKYGLGKPDMERMRFALHILAKMHFAMGAKSVITGIYGLPYKLSPDQVDLIKSCSLDPRRWVAICTHLFGGCMMGADPNRFVCDQNGKVHGYEGLYIGDASQIPTTLGVNPQHTIMALARLRAKHLLAQ